MLRQGRRERIPCLPCAHLHGCQLAAGGQAPHAAGAVLRGSHQEAAQAASPAATAVAAAAAAAAAGRRTVGAAAAVAGSPSAAAKAAVPEAATVAPQCVQRLQLRHSGVPIASCCLCCFPHLAGTGWLGGSSRGLRDGPQPERAVVAAGCQQAPARGPAHAALLEWRAGSHE